MALVNNIGNNVKDSRWLQLEVCREYQRNKCTRPDTECKFAHPSSNVEIQNGRVIACYDSIKGRCNREKPPCKYFHPPQHLKDQLLVNGRNHLALKNALLHQMPLQTVLTTGQMQVGGMNYSNLLAAYNTRPNVLQQIAAQQRNNAAAAVATANLLNGTTIPSTNSSNCKATSSPYSFTNLPAAIASASSAYGAYSPTVIPGLISHADHLTNNYGVFPSPAALIASPKAVRTDRLEVCREFQRGNCKRPESECRYAHPPEHVQTESNDGVVTVCMDYIKGRCSRDQCRYFHPPPHLQAQLKAAQTRVTSTALPNASPHTLAEAAVSSLAGKKRTRDPAEEFVMTFPGLMPITKRPALEKSGIPVYQPGSVAYQHALAMHHTFVPLSLAGHPSHVPRF